MHVCQAAPLFGTKAPIPLLQAAPFSVCLRHTFFSLAVAGWCKAGAIPVQGREWSGRVNEQAVGGPAGMLAQEEGRPQIQPYGRLFGRLSDPVCAC